MKPEPCRCPLYKFPHRKVAACKEPTGREIVGYVNVAGSERIGLGGMKIIVHAGRYPLVRDCWD